MDLIDAIKAIDKPHEDDVLNRLYTVWGENLDKDNVLPEYPRPRFVRDEFINLNGTWEYKIVQDISANILPADMNGEILVPFSPESFLSGVEKRLLPDQILWYKKVLPPLKRKHANSRFLLHFGAVDQFAEIYVNSSFVGSHVGGYLPFTLDITDHLKFTDNESTALNTLIHVNVRDTSDSSYHSRGKQTLRRGGMYYTAQSGIWQTVWIEEVPETYIRELIVTPSQDLKSLTVEVSTNKPCDINVSIPGCETKEPQKSVKHFNSERENLFSSDTYPSNSGASNILM